MYAHQSHNVLLSILTCVVIIFITISAPATHAADDEPFSFEVKQGCGDNEGRNDIYTLVYDLRGVDYADVSVAVIRQGGNALVISNQMSTISGGKGVLAEIYLDVDSFATFSVAMSGADSSTITVNSGEHPCPDGWQPGAPEILAWASAGHCYYATLADDNGLWLLTDAAHPGGIIWTAEDDNYVHIIGSTGQDTDASHYYLDETMCE